MDGVAHQAPLQTFNGPLEAGMRAVALLHSSFPSGYDLQRLTALDYLLVRTGQLGGPDSLHPSAPIQTPATEVRRRVVQDGLLLMMTRDLVARVADARGFFYRAGEAATFFLESVQTPYLRELKFRAEWLVDYLSEHTDAEFDALMHTFFDRWVQEFQEVERSFGNGGLP